MAVSLSTGTTSSINSSKGSSTHSASNGCNKLNGYLNEHEYIPYDQMGQEEYGGDVAENEKDKVEYDEDKAKKDLEKYKEKDTEWKKWGQRRAHGGRDFESAEESEKLNHLSGEETSTNINPYTDFNEYAENRSKKNEKYLQHKMEKDYMCMPDISWLEDEDVVKEV